jgi:hypothetical protein
MKRFVLSTLTLLAFAASVWADGVYFKYDPRAYEQQTVIYATLVDNNGTRVATEPSYSYYLGAFLNGECRYEAEQQIDAYGYGYFELRVGGTDNEAKLGQHISFRIYKVYNDPTGAPTKGTEYELDETQYVPFSGDDLVGDLSNPKKIIFMPVPSVMLQPEIKVYRGATVDLTTYIYKESYETLPKITWDGSEGSEYYTLNGSKLTAVQKTPGEAGVPLFARWGNDESAMTRIMIEVMATAATWKDEYRNGLVVPLGNDQLINDVLSTGYTLTPADASTTFTWTSSNTEVVDFISTTGTWMPKSVGTAKLTGIADDDSGITLTLDVTVIQPVTAIRLSQQSIYAEVNEDITDRLDALVTVYPQNATNNKVTWKIDEGNTAITWSNNRFIASAITKEGDVNTMTVTAQDGYGAHAQLTVNVIPVTPKKLIAKQETLHLTQTPGVEEDLTPKFINNLKIEPEGLLADNYHPMFESSDNTVINVETPPENAAQIITIRSAGQCAITATISFTDYTNTDATGAPGFNQLSTTFTVIVQDGLGSFAFEDVVMSRDDVYTLTLKPQPEGVDVDASKVKLTVKAAERSNFPESWTFVETAAADNTGLVYTLNAKSAGNGTITVTYDDQPMGQGPISVGQRLKMVNGWQWIALYDGVLTNTDQMKAAFGNNLIEVRSQDKLLINDSGLGYFGSLPGLQPMETYKLHLKDVPQEGKAYEVPDYGYLILANHSEYLAFQAYKGWNWIGNPYQYYQSLSSLTGTFTENDVIKGKNGQAVYTANNGWEGSLKFFTPGEGVLLYKQEAGNVAFTAEFDLTQQTEVPVQAARAMSTVPEPWTFDHSQFDDNMAMVARVANVDDPSRVTVWAFVGNECRGRGVAIGERQYITVHGNVGERVTFRLYDEVTGCFHDVFGSRTLAPISGTYTNPVQLFAGQVTAIENLNANVNVNANVYDLQGRRVNGNVNKGIYIRDGRKVVK